MGVRAARLVDLPAIRRLERDQCAALVAPLSVIDRRSSTAMVLASSWRSLGKRTQTLSMREGRGLFGFVQATARAGCESWDIVRLACLAPDDATWVRICGMLLDQVGGAAAQSGALRTFARVVQEGPALEVLAERGFRPYASEITYRGVLRPLTSAAPVAGRGVRVRLARDAWDVFSLYCAVTPALIRHAEGRSLKEWAAGHGGDRTALPWAGAGREALMGEIGNLAAWIRWRPVRSAGCQVLEAMVRPDAGHLLPALLRFGVEHLGLDADCVTLCRVREYDSGVSEPLLRGGFAPVVRETLLVRHTVARVTDHQLLVAALRSQALGIDISHFHDVAETVPLRMAASREVERQYNDQFDQSARASGY
jgi:hypothetical protein